MKTRYLYIKEQTIPVRLSSLSMTSQSFKRLSFFSTAAVSCPHQAGVATLPLASRLPHRIPSCSSSVQLMNLFQIWRKHGLLANQNKHLACAELLWFYSRQIWNWSFCFCARNLLKLHTKSHNMHHVMVCTIYMYIYMYAHV